MPFVDIGGIAATRVPPPFARSLRMVMSPETHPDVSGFTLIESTLAPEGGCTDDHTHDGSGELMMFVSGTGKAWLDGREHEVRPGTAMYAPPGVPHRTLNTGAEPLVILCVFVPPVAGDYLESNAAAAGSGDG